MGLFCVFIISKVRCAKGRNNGAKSKSCPRSGDMPDLNRLGEVARRRDGECLAWNLAGISGTCYDGIYLFYVDLELRNACTFLLQEQEGMGVTLAPTAVKRLQHILMHKAA
jgi:hypothetical protein